MLLAIETSCDETAVCVVDLVKAIDGSYDILSDKISSQVKIHQPYGGIVPELASREHLRNLPLMVKEALPKDKSIRAVAVTQGPGLKGCLLVGLCFAKAFAFGRGIPLIPVNHLEGHLMSAHLLSPAPAFPALALVVSGGHTLLVLMRDFRNYEQLASTRDDAAGEAFDKTATLLGLPYPGGPALSKLALDGDPKRFDFPRGVRADPGSFSFSGLKTAVARTIQSEDSSLAADIAASTEEAIVEALIEKTKAACQRHKPRSLIVAGGVAANRKLRERAQELAEAQGLELAIPPPKWCTDNAAMIAAVAANIVARDPEAYLQWEPQSDKLGPEASFDIGPLPRYPIHEL